MCCTLEVELGLFGTFQLLQYVQVSKSLSALCTASLLVSMLRRALLHCRSCLTAQQLRLKDSGFQSLDLERVRVFWLRANLLGTLSCSFGVFA